MSTENQVVWSTDSRLHSDNMEELEAKKPLPNKKGEGHRSITKTNLNFLPLFDIKEKNT